MPGHLRRPMLASNAISPTRRTILAGIAASGASAALKVAPAVARTADLPTTIVEAGNRFRSGDLTSFDLTKAYLAGIEKLEPQLNAFIAVLKDEALTAATERDGAPRRQGPRASAWRANRGQRPLRDARDADNRWIEGFQGSRDRSRRDGGVEALGCRCRRPWQDQHE